MRADIDRARVEARELWRRNDTAALTALFAQHPGLGREWIRGCADRGLEIFTNEGPLLEWASRNPQEVTLICRGVLVPGLWDNRIARSFIADCAEDLKPDISSAEALHRLEISLAAARKVASGVMPGWQLKNFHAETRDWARGKAYHQSALGPAWQLIAEPLAQVPKFALGRVLDRVLRYAGYRTQRWAAENFVEDSQAYLDRAREEVSAKLWRRLFDYLTKGTS